MSADRGASVAPETTDAAASPARPVKAKPAAKPRSSAARSSSARTKASTTSKPAAKTSTAKSASTKTTAAKADDAPKADDASGADAAPKPARKPAARRSNPTAAKAPAPVEAGPADSDATEAASAAPGDAATSAAAPASAAAKTTAARKPAARKPAARKPSSRSTAAPAEVEPEAVDASPEEPTEAAASKRSAASRSASSSAAAKRTAAAKNARTPSISLAQAKERAADARKKAVARQRVAAAMTTDTTEAERPPRRSDDSVAPAKADPAPVAEEAPVVEAPVAEEPVVEAPAEDVVVEEPEAGRSVAEESLAEEPAAAEPVVEEPVAEEPAAEPVEAPSEVDDDARAVGDERGVAVIPVGSSKPAPRKKRTLRVARPAPEAASRVLAIDGLVKRYGDTTAVDAISLEVRAGSFYGIVGPNGAGKTTTLSMVTGLLRPDAGTVHINDIDVWKDPRAAKRATGVLPDRLRLFDRLTGSELLYYSGSLRGLDHATVLDRSADLATAFGLEDALDRLVADYSAGMTKKIALACAMIHSPRLLVLDEPFESVDPVSAANLTDILERYVAGGGTVLLSSHSMDLIERVCDSAAIIVGGRVLASGPLDEVRQGQTLEDRFVELAGGRKAAEGLEWLHSFSD
ncbi:Daunorubicin/doxorubicin resistance ATP-binding protein DrrA [Agromyces sp. NDB4Y10]|uniref:ABC transporter ATP-binding protein n=1 Tax=Agromyces sp. NDB4Y10 TaxID=1775951 RepID=UPI0007B1C79F|nr:ABC transporter ATP-binding protein [Agromyces sp. NDB4Y10]KZE92185.1 Daunorubicin/doxorubicin resistance ATP-binding protein DrrA [Agromyces sp. NDB4Y10]